MIDPELLELLESTVQIAPVASRGLDGKRTYSANVPYRAHVEYRNDMVRNSNGEEVMSSGKCHLDGYYPAVEETHRVTLPDASTHKVVAVGHSFDSNGPYQTTVFW